MHLPCLIAEGRSLRSAPRIVAAYATTPHDARRFDRLISSSAANAENARDWDHRNQERPRKQILRPHCSSFRSDDGVFLER
jgi:hypothetical protein